tara:strand:+ start:2307 stop:2543 length:237 start_codon:yes stop_codon:yes gene_type:complete
MPYHTGEKKKPMTKKPMNKKPMKKSSKLSEKQMKQLETHSKKHKGGMSSTHIKNMKKFMISGDSFIVAHNKAVKLDKK